MTRAVKPTRWAANPTPPIPNPRPRSKGAAFLFHKNPPVSIPFLWMLLKNNYFLPARFLPECNFLLLYGSFGVLCVKVIGNKCVQMVKTKKQKN
ncbi:MAG: hypothetical protein LBM56_03215 [Burkholderiaceae bacterium]|jgi:hypothetical protein|nr:hypothetical protein [Burkholderiaceae bacterium]